MRISSGIAASADVTDRAARLVGAVSAAAGATWDVSDRLARLLGITRDEVVYRIVNAQGFARGASLAPSAGNVSEVQLFNPAASGVTAVVLVFEMFSDTLDQHTLRAFNTALGTLVGAGVNLALGGAAAQSVVRTAQPAAPDGTEIITIRVQASTLWTWPLVGVCALDAGEGVVVVTGGSSERLSCHFVWIEF